MYKFFKRLLDIIVSSVALILLLPLFIPIIIDQSKTDPLVFSNNTIYENWKKDNKITAKLLRDLILENSNFDLNAKNSFKINRIMKHWRE